MLVEGQDRRPEQDMTVATSSIEVSLPVELMLELKVALAFEARIEPKRNYSRRDGA